MALNLTFAYSCPDLPVLISPANNSNFIIDYDNETMTVVLSSVATTQNNGDMYYRFYNATNDGLIYATSVKPSGTPVSCNWGSLGAGTHSWYVRAGPSTPELGPPSVTRTFVCFQEVLDVNQSISDRGFPIHHVIDGDWGGAQNFTPSVDTITRVAIYMRKFGTPEFNLTVDLRENSISHLS